MKIQIQPTEEEYKNGWTPETLTDYLSQRERAQVEATDIILRPMQKNIITHTDNHYNPFKW